MRLNKVTLFLIGFIFTSLITGFYLSSFSNGLIVKYQRVTGPEFVVLESNGYLKDMHNGKKVNIGEVFSSEELDSESGFPNGGKYIIKGEILGIDESIGGSYYSYRIDKMINLKMYRFLQAFLLASILGSLIMAVYSFRNRKDHQTKFNKD